MIVIDTDPGIDDAIAILYALRTGQDVAALTTVAGNIGLDVTTRNALRITRLAGSEVPVHAGADRPLHAQSRPETGIHGDDGLGGVPFPDPDREPAPEPAGAALARLASEGATLFCLAPLTNIARLLTDAPEAARRIARIIAMGGAVDEPGNVGPKAEFNIWQDPDAAAVVLGAGLELTLIPLDATRQLRADRAYLGALRATGAAPAIAAADLIAAYFASTKGGESRPLHDPCVPLFHARPELFRTETRALSVDLDTGALVPGEHEITVVMGLDADALRDELLRGLAA